MIAWTTTHQEGRHQERGDGVIKQDRRPERRSSHSLVVKRIIDVLASLGLLVATSPVIAVVALLTRLRLGSPVLFRQRRPGYQGELFTFLKFRTMSDQRDADGVLLADEQRLSPLGRQLRRLSLDELPQLVNVVRGDMSLVGPRPLLVEYLPHYSDRQARRHEVKPGITGWAQVHGRNALDFTERFEFDVWYVDHRSTRLDLLILARTLWQVVAGHGVSAPGHATMPVFSPASSGDASPSPSVATAVVTKE